MNFMTAGSFKDTFSALSEDEKPKYMLQAVEWVLELKKKMGDNFHFYSTVGWGRLVSIGEYGRIFSNTRFTSRSSGIYEL